MDRRSLQTFFSCGAALLLGFLTLARAADTVEVEGSAPLRDGDLGRARVEAQQNALRQAAMQRNARVQSRFGTDSDGGVEDSVQVRSDAQVRSAEVLGEQLDDGQLHVRVRAELGEGGGRCGFPAAAYRKKIAAVYFPLADPRQVMVNDYFGYERGIPTELLQLLAITGNFLTRDASDVSLYPDPVQAPTLTGATADGRPVVTQLGQERGVQFIVSGVVRDLGFSLSKGWLSSVLDAQAVPHDRNLGIEFFVHDALTGELLARHRYTRTVEGEGVVPDRSVRFGTAAFNASRFGRLFRQVLEEEMMAIHRLLQCRPFTMQVLEQKDGRLYLDAGADTLIKSGDLLTLYRPDIRGPVFGVDGRLSQFGRAKTTIRVLEVYPGYSIAEPETEAGTVAFAPGEYLRAW